MENGKKMVEMMRKRMKDRLAKERGGSIEEKLAAARKRRKEMEKRRGFGQGAKKVEDEKAKIRRKIMERYE